MFKMKLVAQSPRSATEQIGGDAQTGQLSVSAVPRDLADHAFASILPTIERAVARGDVDLNHIRSGIMSGDMLLWAVHEAQFIVALIVLRINERLGRRVLHVVAIAGSRMDEWFSRVYSLLDDYRAVIGADSIDALCRPGLARLLESRGWRKKAVLMGVSHGR